MKQTLCFARKTLLEYLREPLLWGLVLAFPPLMVAIMYFAFGQPQQSLARTLRVLVINQDKGAPAWQAGADLIQAMRATTFEGQPVFSLNKLDSEPVAQVILQENRAAVLLIIPSNFSQNLLDKQAHPTSSPPPEITLVGNPASFNYVFAKSFIQDLVRGFVRQATQQAENVIILYEFIPGTGKLSDFDFMTPGMVVFGVLFLIISTATTLVRENVANTLVRLRLTRAHAGHMLLGVALAQLLIVAIQVPLAFGVAVMCGFGSSGNISPASLAMASGIGILCGLSAIGIGLIVAAFAHNDGDATNLAMIPLVPMAFLSGAIYPMPALPLFTIAGQAVSVYDLMSSTHAAEAMRRILVYGDSLPEITYQLVMLVILSAVYLGIGIALYKFRLK